MSTGIGTALKVAAASLLLIQVVSVGPIVTSQTYEFTTLTCSLEGFSITDDSELLLLQIRGNFPDEQRVALATLDKSAGARESSSLKTYFPVSGVSGTIRGPDPALRLNVVDVDANFAGTFVCGIHYLDDPAALDTTKRYITLNVSQGIRPASAEGFDIQKKQGLQVTCKFVTGNLSGLKSLNITDFNGAVKASWSKQENESRVFAEVLGARFVQYDSHVELHMFLPDGSPADGAKYHCNVEATQTVVLSSSNENHPGDSTRRNNSVQSTFDTSTESPSGDDELDLTTIGIICGVSGVACIILLSAVLIIKRRKTHKKTSNSSVRDCKDEESAVLNTKDSNLDTSDSFVKNGLSRGSPKTFPGKNVTEVKPELTNLMNDDYTEAKGHQRSGSESEISVDIQNRLTMTPSSSDSESEE